VAALTASLALLCVFSAHASALSAHGHLLQLAPHARVHTNQSTNWFGYQQGALEQGGKLFHAVTGDWTVPTVSQHTKGQSEASSDWIGIGGGCIDADCAATDPTLIQTGTEQDVDANGTPSYSAWWELIPLPGLTITNMTVRPGDHMHAEVSEIAANSDLWNIKLQDVTRGQTFTITVPYPSTHATAEWIEETPLLIGANTGLASLPDLSNPNFDLGTTNGSPVVLKSSEQMQLVDSSRKVIGLPSAPDSDADGFGACTWATSCSAPPS
jgi:hypothetical protein